LTKAGSTVGTTAYMSPEQTQGKPADRRSDLFSVGVVLYELIAGRTPFKKENEASTIHAIINEHPEPLARFKVDVPEGVQRIIDKLLDKDPDIRYQTASDLKADILREKRLLDSGVSSSPSSPISTVGSPRSANPVKWFVSASAAVIILIVALVMKPWNINVEPVSEVMAAEDRLAIMYFENLADPSDSLRLAEIVTSLLITDISETPHLNVLSSQRLYDLLKQLGREGERLVDRETATQVAQRAKARWMVTGNILQTEPRLIMTAQVIDVATGQVEASQRSTGEEDEDVFAQIDRLTDALTSDLALPEVDMVQDGRSLAEVTTHSREAYRCYLEGIDLENKLYRTDAKKCFEHAIELDSTFAMAYYRLVRGWSGAAEADDYIRNAVKFSEQTNRLQRLYILALADVVAGDYDGAIADLKQIVAEYPEEKEAHSQLAHIYAVDKLDFEAAIKHYEAALAIDPFDKNIYNDLAYKYKDLRQYDKALEYIDKYISLVPDEPNPYDSRGEIAAAAGDFDLAIASYQEALARDPGFENALFALFSVHLRLDDPELADSCARALAGDADKDVRADGRTLLSMISVYQGKLKRAIQLFEGAIAADRLEQSDEDDIKLDKYWGKAVVMTELGMHDSALVVLEFADAVSKRKYPNIPLHFQDQIAITTARAENVVMARKMLQTLEPLVLNSSMSHAKADFYHAQSCVAYYAGDFNAAITYATESLPFARRTRRPQGEYLLARAHLGAGHPGDAIPLLEWGISHLENVYQWNPIHAVKAHYLLGTAYEQINKIEQAIKQYEQFLSLWKDADPGIPEVENARARLKRLRQAS